MNLAGAGKPIAAVDVTIEQWEGIFNVFLRSTFLFCQAKHSRQFPPALMLYWLGLLPSAGAYPVS